MARLGASKKKKSPHATELRQLKKEVQRLTEQLESYKRELAEGRERETATGEILRVIASSPTDLQPVLDVVAENAAHLCDSQDAQIHRVEGDMVRKVASYGSISPVFAVGEVRPISRDSGFLVDRAILDGQTIHIHDNRIRRGEDVPQAVQRLGIRTALAVPLMREGVPVGAIMIRRTEVRPFTAAQIKLLETFADQAVIAIENVRLFNELKESLEQQTATSEILGVIASSPTDIQPVLDVVAESAARLCESKNAVIFRLDGDVLRLAAIYGPVPIPPTEIPLSRALPVCRAVLDRQTIHVPDIAAQTEYPEGHRLQQLTGTRAALATPLLREGLPVGAIIILRVEARPFTNKQIVLLKTFADQAVIAIENVRLFQELQVRNRDLTEALEQQTATGEVLRVIASSPAILQPVLDTVIANAIRLIGAEHGHIRQYDGEFLQLVAYYNVSAEGAAAFRETPVRPGRETGPGRAFLERKPIHIPDVEQDPTFELPPVRLRTFLAVPMLREGIPIGTISIWRETVAPFTERQIELVTTFADQAVIAIENTRLFQELKESLEQQTATSEILGVIASSPTDIQPVLDAVAESAARLCDANDAQIGRVEGDFVRQWASYGTQPAPGQEEKRPITRGFVGTRAIVDRQTVHIHDLAVESDSEFPESKILQQRFGTRTILATPLLREGVPIGVINVRRTEVRPFTDKQVKLLETFASQAVIAIENVRLFKELQERNAELREALEHQTATSEVLGIISRSPTDVQPVLDAIVESAARVCRIDDVVLRLREGNILVTRAHFGPVPVRSDEISINAPQNRWMSEHGTLHIRDGREQNDFPMLGFPAPARTYLLVPLRQQRELIGTLTARRIEVRPFTPVQIKLLETFADQAVIAIENVRLFQELKESLEQQTATSEILGVIASSPTDIQPVLDVVAENAARLCEANDAVIVRTDNDKLRIVAHYGSVPAPGYGLPIGFGQPISRGSPHGRAVIDRQTIQMDDLATAIETEFPDSKDYQERIGTRTVLATPLSREGVSIGAIMIRRTEVRPFTEKQIKLLETFADQAVIAIENVRLFQELKESLEQQTATSHILGVIAGSPTEIQPVVDTIAENAAKVCGADDAVIRLVEGNVLRTAAHYGPVPDVARERPIDRRSPGGRAVVDRQVIHIEDALSLPEAEFPETHPSDLRVSTRTILAVPLMREDVPIGSIHMRRMEVRPFTDKQISLLKTFADQAVIAIENVRLFKELDERTNELTRSVGELKALGEVGQTVSSTLDLETVLTRIVSHTVQLSGTDGGAIYEYYEQSEEFLLRATDHMEEELINALRANPPRLGTVWSGGRRRPVNRSWFPIS